MPPVASMDDGGFGELGAAAGAWSWMIRLRQGEVMSNFAAEGTVRGSEVWRQHCNGLAVVFRVAKHTVRDRGAVGGGDES